MLKDFFANDIERHINPAVVVGEKTEEIVNQEISEYVFTTELMAHVHTLLDRLLNKKTGKTAVWVNGYYGSGKSHYIKYVSYCLNPKTKDAALANFINAVQHQKDDLPEVSFSDATKIQRDINQAQVEQIIFNIDEVSKRKHQDNVLVEIFFNQFNRFRGFSDSNISLALLLEKRLEEKGLFDAFKQKIQEKLNDTWDGQQAALADLHLDIILEALKELDPSIDVNSLHAAITRTNNYTIQHLVAELKNYTASKPDNYRLVFLADEVSQYIGSNTSLLLNLQTLVESIATECNNKVWIICTAQQELTYIANNTENKSEDFGKILGRFETRISLQTTDAAYITKKRLLEKNSDGTAELQTYFTKNKVGIENQFAQIHDLYKGYEDREDFILTYPFVPYQFRLISEVFASFSALKYVGEGVKNTERSILGITHFTTKQFKAEKLGFFVPFDLFFNDQFESNINHIANNILQRAYSIDAIKKDPFAKRVVKVLFMVSNLSETVKLTFPANVDNLTLLMYENITQGKQELRENIGKILQELTSQKIIQETENTYRFLKEDEIEVANLIDSVALSATARLELFYDEIISKAKMGKSDQKYTFGNNTFKATIKIDDKIYGNISDFVIQYVVYDNVAIENLALSTAKNEIKICIHEWLNEDKIFKEDFFKYAKTATYLAQNSTNSIAGRKETNERFAKNNSLLIESLQKRYVEKLRDTNFIVGQQAVFANELAGEPATRFDKIIERHLSELYSKNLLSKSYATRDVELAEQANIKQTAGIKELTPAEQEMESKLLINGEGFSVSDLVKLFEKEPYGWKDISTLDVLLRLVQKEKRRLEYKNEPIQNDRFATLASNSRERMALAIFAQQGIPAHELQAFVQAVNFDIFAQTLIPNQSGDAKQVVIDFKDSLKPILEKANKAKETHQKFAFSSHFEAYHKLLSAIYLMRNDHEIIKQVMSQKELLKTTRDNFTNAVEFVENNLDAYLHIGQFIKEYGANFNALDDTTQTKGARLQEWFSNDNTAWERFPEMKKINKELEAAIKEHIKQYRENVLDAYHKAFDFLETKQIEIGIATANTLPNRAYYIEKIEKEKDIRNLKLKENDLSKLQSDALKNLLDAKAEQEKAAGNIGKRAEIYTVHDDPDFQSTQIETEAQMDEYLGKLRKKLLLKIQNNKIIIIK